MYTHNNIQHGRTRPLTILQLGTDSRAQYKKKSYKSMIEMLTPILCILTANNMYAIIITYNVTASGSTKAVRENPAVLEQVLFHLL